MDNILTMRPFVPARDYAVSQRFYQRLGFRMTGVSGQVSFMKLGSFSFLLQDFYQQELSENFMMQLIVRDLDAWWAETDPDAVANEFETRPPRAPAMQSWGLRVGFITDPSGVLWHIVEAVF